MCQRFADARTFYTDAGVIPRAWIAENAGPWRISLYLANGQTWFAASLLAAEALAALALALGWRSRLAALACFVLQASLLNRNEMVLIGGDELIGCLLFWSIFLPLGAHWSIDRAAAAQPPPQRHLSWASAGLLLQVMSVYFFSALLKSGPEWWPDGTAVYYALQLDLYATGLGTSLRPDLALQSGLTYFVYFLELLGPLAVFLPLLNAPLRFVAIVLFAAMQFGFLLCLKLGPFPAISLAALTPFLGSWVWNAFDHRALRGEIRRGAAPLRIYYDGGCGFCVDSCRLLKVFLILPRAQIEPAQDYPRARALLEANRSWVVIDHDDRAYLKWPAMVRLLHRSPGFAWLGWMLSGSWLLRPGNALYDFAGRHRPALGRFTGWLLAPRTQPAPVRTLPAVVLFALLAWNLGTIGVVPRLLPLLRPPLELLRLDQIWNMFAPYPAKDGGWYVFPGELADGRAVDVLHPERLDTGVSYDKPGDVAGTVPNIRWRKFMENLWNPLFAQERPIFGKFLCREWNRDHPAQSALKSFKMVYMLNQSVAPGETRTVEQRVFWRQECFGMFANPAAGD
jgi:predicted DCC family thiol-disulfide oxidoreductase YuxK